MVEPFSYTKFFNNFFESHSARDILTFILLFVFILMEYSIPFIRFYYNKKKHILLNYGFQIFHILVSLSLVGLVTYIVKFDATYQFGILHVINLPFWAEIIFTIMFYDLFYQYLFHWMSHKIPVFWLLHTVHHSDTTLDSSTSFRRHPIEEFTYFFFFCFITLILGSSLELLTIYLTVHVNYSLFTHANISLPPKVNKYLSYIMVTPNFHQIHHHFTLPYTDSNYGSIFAIWDRVFGTCTFLPNEKIKYGVDVISDSTDNNLWYQLKLPFIYKK
ncbi:MAG: sterol desaturase family protein [Sediminibacterium sp.]|nr:sterol desaturase family protein [Sediminibacterium sp.]